MNFANFFNRCKALVIGKRQQTCQHTRFTRHVCEAGQGRFQNQRAVVCSRAQAAGQIHRHAAAHGMPVNHTLRSARLASLQLGPGYFGILQNRLLRRRDGRAHTPAPVFHGQHGKTRRAQRIDLARVLEQVAECAMEIQQRGSFGIGMRQPPEFDALRCGGGVCGDGLGAALRIRTHV